MTELWLFFLYLPIGEAAFSKVAERNKKVQERLDKVLGVWNSGVSTTGSWQCCTAKAGKKGLRERALGEAARKR